MTRCPSCGAANPERAAWCGQCYVSLTKEAAAAASDSSPPPFRRTEEGFEWACPRCGAYTSLDSHVCRECGTPIRELTESETGLPPDTNWQAALLLSAALPGAGHLAIGRAATGVGRAVLYVLWLASGLLALASGGLIVAIPLLLGAVALWVMALFDLQQLRQGRQEILTGRVLLWLVVAVIGLTILTLFSTMPRLGAT